MKTRTALLLVTAVILFSAAGYLYLEQQEAMRGSDTNPDDSSTPAQESARVMSIESYITQNISALSPVKEQLGGTFYVTAIEAEAGRGSVSYEDGHNAYTADFTYTIDDERGIEITSFIVRE